MNDTPMPGGKILEADFTPKEKPQTTGRKKKKVGKDEIEKAKDKLNAFKSAKQELNTVIKFNEQWYRQRHMEYIRTGKKLRTSAMEGDTVPHYKQGELVEPVSAWLFNSIQNFHADYMDNYPRANVLPREKNDELEAEKIRLILPVLLDRIRFEAVYSRAGWTKAIQGWTVYSVTWDPDEDDGRGDVAVNRVKLLNLYWDMEVDELEASSDIFYLHERDIDDLKRDYPKLAKDLEASQDEVERHETTTVGITPRKATVVDWYYKARNSKGRRVLHYAQFVGDVLLYASENEPAYAERGFYDHGRYPFVVDVLYPMEDALHGFGKVAVGSSKQAYIDILSQAIMKNALWSANPRYFAKKGHGFNLEDFMDVTKMVVEIEGNPSENLMRMDVDRVDSVALSLKESMVEELRETTNMRDVATGSTTGGVTAASGIAALQEAAGKMSRDSNRTSFRAFREIVSLIIELIRQFYTEAHVFRIVDEETGDALYMSVDNSGLHSETGGALFDLEITTERNSSYTRMAQNELMLSFFNAGFFNPSTAPSALACLNMMDFEGKDELIRMVGENYNVNELLNALMEQLLVTAQSYDQLAANVGIESNQTASVQNIIQQVQAAIATGDRMTGAAQVPEAIAEPAQMKKAREGAAGAASPT